MVTELDLTFVEFGVEATDRAAAIIKALGREVVRLESGMKEAVRIIKEGKSRFRPDTTNSDVDVFLREWSL